MPADKIPEPLAAKSAPATASSARAHRIEELAGRILRGDRAPSDYLKDVKAALGERLEEVLATNLISPAAFAAALADDYDAFLLERSKIIDEAVSQLTGW
jgi:hypothetical protein